ncbi:unnamed protein product [Didymodactylos carnosus]|uniref:Uncharacterized protein n=1 Tax=Didymodactylos carnosus TaxID=1234261 RepID=A0A815UW05_9BILA|nr:unnamed protein product [Didymodactylos carnosus]CAF1522530.1 unnamed protein product [Didymodactylos carnosus]CAF4256682.1 unnamed protein product [Didymodactylos carnosus]CAF4381726.1 unnamed protein product [Didymodactylos carnosus]
MLVATSCMAWTVENQVGTDNIPDQLINKRSACNNDSGCTMSYSGAATTCAGSTPASITIRYSCAAGYAPSVPGCTITSRGPTRPWIITNSTGIYSYLFYSSIDYACPYKISIDINTVGHILDGPVMKPLVG